MARGRGKTDDSVLLEKWLTKPESEIKNRVLLLMRQEILLLRGQDEEQAPSRENNYQEI